MRATSGCEAVNTLSFVFCSATAVQVGVEANPLESAKAISSLSLLLQPGGAVRAVVRSLRGAWVPRRI